MFKPSKIPTPTFKKPYRKVFSRFAGVDYLHDPASVSDNRFPEAYNLITNKLGQPESRPGYRIVNNSLIYPEIAARIFWMDSIKLEDSDTTHLLFATYEFFEGSTRIFINRAEIKNGNLEYLSNHFFYVDSAYLILKKKFNGFPKFSSFRFDKYLYILTGTEYLRYDAVNKTMTAVINGSDVYIPTVMEGCGQSGSNPDKIFKESVNMLSRFRRKGYTTVTGTADMSTRTYFVDSKCDQLTTVMLDGNDITSSCTLSSGSLIINVSVTVNAPESGVDNMFVTYRVTTDLSPDIRRCAIFTTFGIGNANRYFFSGNPEKPNVDWSSGLYDPTYFPEDGYYYAGNSATPIMGYVKTASNLAIIKASSPYDSVVYLRSGELLNSTDSHGNIVSTPFFTVKEGVSGSGAINSFCFSQVQDDPVYLSSTGIKSLISESVTQERSIQDMSLLIDPVLTKLDIKNAIGYGFDNKYYLSINGNIFVADVRQKTAEYGYEWYHWTGINASAFCEVEGNIWFAGYEYDPDTVNEFGHYKAYICRFNDDIEGDAKFHDNGNAIYRSQVTPLFDGNDFMRLKNIKDRGTGVLFKQSEHCSANVYFAADGGEFKLVKKGSFDKPNYGEKSAVVFSTDSLLQNIQLFQIKIENNTLYEGFGVIGVQITYTVGSYARGINND